MSKEKRKSKGSKEATAKREDETSFMEDSADMSLKTGHSRSPGATGGEGSMETSEVSGPGEEGQVKKKRGTFKKNKTHFFKSYLTFFKIVFEALCAVPNQSKIPGW